LGENTNLTVDPGDAPEGVRIDDFEFIALEQGSSNNSFNSARELFFGERSNVESTAPYFFTGPDGGMVFKSPVNGARTSSGTRFPRSELREYVRGGVTRRPNNETISTSGVNENNWVLGYQPNLIFDDNGRTESIENVGGRNGRLAATEGQDGIFEQPFRIGRDAPDINLVGTSTDLDDLQEDGFSTQQIETMLADGIALDELFSYEIINEGPLIIVNLIRGDADQPIIASTTINMETIENLRSGAENDPLITVLMNGCISKQVHTHKIIQI